MATMTRAQFGRQMQDGLNMVWGLEYKPQGQEWEAIFSKHTSDKAYEEDLLMSGVGGAMIKPEGEGIRYDSMREGWTARYTHITVALGLQFSQEAIEDGRYLKLGEVGVKGLANGFMYTKNVIGANVLNNGFDTNYPGGDGKPLFATDHPLSGPDGGVFANTPSTQIDLSEEALEDAGIAIDGFVDERGIPCMARPKNLIVPRQSQFIAERILANKDRPGTANRDINAIKSRGTFGDYSVNHFLADSDAWFVIVEGVGITDKGLKYFERLKIQSDQQDEFESGNIRYKKRERYSMGWTNPRGAYGSSGG